MQLPLMGSFLLFSDLLMFHRGPFPTLLFKVNISFAAKQLFEYTAVGIGHIYHKKTV
ncbi:hypothetical protein [Chryseobacterium culicis]|uniref:hypothetical protein n=1 Tax=Chryseobacterium culicis TaxID=680127 RepID=UPI001428AACE|nr:hypothetical protein [Chryseobacterium culicis]